MEDEMAKEVCRLLDEFHALACEMEFRAEVSGMTDWLKRFNEADKQYAMVLKGTICHGGVR